MAKGRSRAIDRGMSEPAYLQLVKILKEDIERGIYLPGDRLPSESRLCKRYHISPMTVRRSVRALLDEGIVTTVRGSGTYVKAPDLGGVTFGLGEFYRIFNDEERIRVRILEVMIARADEKAASRLSLREGDRTIIIRRMLLRDGDPVLYHREQLIYDPERPIVEAELGVTSLHGLFVGRGGTQLRRGDLVIKAAVLTKEEADVLNTLPMQPAFHLEHIFYDFQDKPVSWGRFICSGDRFEFSAAVGLRKKEQ